MEQSTNVVAEKEDIRKTEDAQEVINTGKYKALLEAILFIEVEPISYKKLSDMLKIPVKEVKKYVVELADDYKKRESGLYISELGNGVKMTTNPVYADFLKQFYKKKRKMKFSKAALETLAIIAYRQPITKAEIESIRGVSSDAIVRDLLDKKLVKVVGKKEDVPGKPMLYGTTKEFLLMFGIKSIKDLPKIKEIKESSFE